jgi:hypothetical protein
MAGDERNRDLTVSVATGLFVATALAVGFKPVAYPPYFEGRDYFSLANGDYSHLEGYYAGRVLHPLVVRAVASVAHLPIDWRSFFFVSVASLGILFCALGAYFAIEIPARPWLYISLAATAIVIDQYRNYYWHDLFFAALLAVFFLTLRINPWISLPILLLLFVTRESTFILVFAIALIAAFRREWIFSASALVLGALGARVNSRLVAHALPQHHGIPVFLLDLLKIPYNFALNVCGLEFWTNTNAATISDPLKWVADLPPWIHLGNIHQIGYCGFFVDRPVKLLLLALTAFGTMPLLVALSLLKGYGRPLLQKLDCAVAVLYGGLMFVLAALTGTNPARYVLYAWPIFWIFGAASLSLLFRERKRTLVEFLALSAFAAWIPAMVGFATESLSYQRSSFFELSRMETVASLAILVPVYWRSHWLLKRQSSSAAGRGARTASAEPVE